MKLTILNGSPREKNSNSSLIIQWLTEGLLNNSLLEKEVFYLNNIQKHKDYLECFLHSDCVIMVFPLYTDCMPGLVMAFIEELGQIKRPLTGLKLGYIIHSGFPEAHQSRYVERYMVSLTKKLGADYIGTVIMPSSEGIKIMPDTMTRKKRNLFKQLGQRFTENGRFDNEIIKKIAGTEKMSELGLLVYKVISKLGLTNFYWNNQLKSNNAYNIRFDKPYIDK